MTAPLLPDQPLRDQRWIGLGLILLMAMTRGHHFASVDALPSASWAVIFLAGVFLTPRWSFPLLLLEAVLLDVLTLGDGFTAAYCVSPAYVMLLPAYATLWLGGRLYARLHRDRLRTLGPLLALLLASAFISNLFSSGGFYYFSGRFVDPDPAGLWQRIQLYFPQRLPALLGYVALVGLVLRSWQRVRRHSVANERY